MRDSGYSRASRGGALVRRGARNIQSTSRMAWRVKVRLLLLEGLRKLGLALREHKRASFSYGYRNYKISPGPPLAIPQLSPAQKDKKFKETKLNRNLASPQPCSYGLRRLVTSRPSGTVFAMCAA